MIYLVYALRSLWCNGIHWGKSKPELKMCKNDGCRWTSADRNVAFENGLVCWHDCIVGECSYSLTSEFC